MTVKKIHMIFIGLLALCLQISAESTINIAVLDLEPNGIQAYEARTLSDKLRFELLNTGVFTMVERSQMEDILKEQGFQQTGCTSQACAVEIGQLIGVRKMVMGSIGVIGGTFLLSLRVINVENGRIEKMIQKEFESSLSEVLKTGIHASVQELFGFTTNSAAAESKKTIKKDQTAEKSGQKKDNAASRKESKPSANMPLVKTASVNNPNRPIIEVDGLTFRYVYFQESPGAYENKFITKARNLLTGFGFEQRQALDRPGTLNCRIFIDSPSDGGLVASVSLSCERGEVMRSDQPVDKAAGAEYSESAIDNAVIKALQELDSDIKAHQIK